MRMNQLSGGKLILGAAVAAAIFAFDLLLPLGVAAGVPYVFLVLLGMWAPNTRHVFALAALGTRGPAHLINMLRKDLHANMGQLGLHTLADAKHRLVPD